MCLLAAMPLISACTKSAEEVKRESLYAYPWEVHVPFATNYQVFSMPVSDDFGPIPLELGPVAMSEASGIAYSRKNPGKIWAHNDSGHTNALFLLDANTGATVARYIIGGTSNIDWEDMEIAVGPDSFTPWIYIADTGDNSENRPDYSIYRFEEPAYDSTHFGQVIHLNDVQVDRIRFTYPDGSHDTEAMFVDPVTLDIFLATKRDEVSMLYVIPYPQLVDQVYEIFKAGAFSFRSASAGTVSESGNRVLIKNRQEIFYWERAEGESMTEMLSRTPVKAPYAGEPQGEAICFDDEYNYYTLSEELNQDQQPILYKYLFNN